MNKDALAKYALKTFVGSQQQQKQAVATRNEQVELQQKQAKKHWWSRSTTTRPDSILSIQEQKLLKRVKNRAHFLDRGISLCCFQVGFDGLVGFVPVIGDFIGLLMALNLVHTCMEADLPNDLVSRMMFNIAFDFVIGLVPVIGDIMDIMYKCNTKNAILLEDYLIKRRKHMLAENPKMTATTNSHHHSKAGGGLVTAAGTSTPSSAAAANSHKKKDVPPPPYWKK